MKRRLIDTDRVAEYVPPVIPDDLMEYAAELRLLNGVPFAYLLSDGKDLNTESIRFFFLDINWTDALVDGAFSIGRVCAEECRIDGAAKTARAGREFLHAPRMKRMHPNHKDTQLTAAPSTEYTTVSGFIMRSELTRRMKGLRIYGYDEAGAPKDNNDDGNPLTILRMDTLADDVMVCLFRGAVQEVMFAEPKTGLRFGVSNVNVSGGTVSRSIDLRSALDDASDLGTRIKTLCIDTYVEQNGRIKAKALAEYIGGELKSAGKLDTPAITPSRFAFEMIATAHRAKFRAGKAQHD